VLLSRWWYYLTSIPTLMLGVRNWPTMLACFLHLPFARPFILELRNGLRFWVRTPMDIWIIKEVCLDHQYERAGTEFQDGWTVLDVGAGLGEFAVTVARKNPNGAVYAYEPFAPSLSLLRDNLGLNHVTNVQAFPCAVAAEAGATHMQLASEAVAHSIVATAGASTQDAEEVQAVTLDQIWADLQLSRCDYLKMDCEGAEFPVFLKHPPSVLQRIDRLCLEYHDNLTPWSHRDLVRFFQEQGFRVRLTPCPAHAHLGLLYAERGTRPEGSSQTPAR